MIGVHEPSCAPSRRPACRLRPDLQRIPEPGRADRRADRGGLPEDLRRHRVGEADRAAGAHVVPGVSAGRGHAGGVAARPAGPVAAASGGDRQRAGRPRGGVRVAARGDRHHHQHRPSGLPYLRRARRVRAGADRRARGGGPRRRAGPRPPGRPGPPNSPRSKPGWPGPGTKPRTSPWPRSPGRWASAAAPSTGRSSRHPDLQPALRGAGAARPACGRPPGLPAGRRQAGSAAVTEGDNSQGVMAVRGAQIDYELVRESVRGSSAVSRSA